MSTNVNTTTNTIVVQNANQTITVVDNNNNISNTVNVTQPLVNIVEVNTPGPRGPQGPAGSSITGGATNYIPVWSSTSSLTTSSIYVSSSTVIITGSLSVSGSITSSLFGTASWAINALTASYAPSSPAFPYVGTAVITGSLIVSQSTSIRGTFNQGSSSLASGLFSHVQGFLNTASGDYSHAEGRNTITTGNYSHAEGDTTISTGNASHAEGESTQAIGLSSHAEGAYTQAIGEYSHTEGTSTLTGTTKAYQSYFPLPGIVQLDGAYGDLTTEFVAGDRLFLYDAPFTNTYGKTTFIVSQSYYSAPSTYIELVDTSVTTTTAYVGSLNYGIANWTGNATIPGNYSHTEGGDTQAIGNYSHAEGASAQAVGLYSHAEGEITAAIGQSSHAEGNNTQAIGPYSHAEGGNTQAIGEASHAEGRETIASGVHSHAEGRGTITTGSYSHAEGSGTITIGDYSHAEGLSTVALGNYQHVQGQYNISSSAQSAFIIGNGTSDAARSNLIFASGSQFQITGSLIVSGSSTFTNIGPAIFSGSVNSQGGFTGSLQGTASFALAVAGGGSTFPYVGNAVITGSLIVSGSGIGVTGSINATSITSSFTGSLTGALIGTASWATNAVSASFASTASFVNPLRQNVIISGSVFVSSSILGSGSTYNTTIDLQNALILTNNTNSIAYGTKYLLDDASVRAVHWNSRLLTDSVNSVSVDWSTRRLLSGSTTVLDWSSGTGSLFGTATSALTASYSTKLGANLVTSSIGGLALRSSDNTILTQFNTFTSSLALTASLVNTTKATAPNNGLHYLALVTQSGADVSAREVRWLTNIYADPTTSTMYTGRLIATSVSASLTGSLTGALTGTASYATQALSASYAPGGSSTPTFPYTGSAIISGSLVITGSFNVGVPGTNNPRITSIGTLNRGDVVSVDWVNKQLQDASTSSSVDWENRSLYDTVGNTSVDWSGRILYTPSGENALTFDNNIFVTSNIYKQQNTKNNSIGENFSNTLLNYSGHSLEASVTGSATTGTILYLDTDGTWKTVNQTTATSTKMLGICLDTNVVLLEGDVVLEASSMVKTPAYGAPLYIWEGGTVLSSDIPTSGYVRVLGHCYYRNTSTTNNWIVKFRPSSDWFEI